MTTPRSATSPIVPATLAQVRALAKTLAAGSAVPLALQGKPDNIIALIVAGSELGLPAMSAVRNLYIAADGVIAMKADAMAGLCISRGEAVYFRCSDDADDHTTYETKRGSQAPQSWTWTDLDTFAAGLQDRPWWQEYPRQMRHARAKSALARAAYPDIMAGIFSTEEVQDFPHRYAEGNAVDDVPSFRVGDPPRKTPRSFTPDVDPVPCE